MIEGLRRRFQARRLDAPRSPALFGAHYDPDAFGRLSEGIARFFGTARYLVFQTVMVFSWILVGYYLLRRYRPDMKRPFRLPEFFKYIALVLAVGYFVIWLYGGIVEASLPNAFLGNNDTKIYYLIGWIILVSYLPIYWYRVKVEDPKHAASGTPEPPPIPAGD